MIAEVPISVILTLLEKPEAHNVQYVLRSLCSSQSTITKASKPEIIHLTSRTINLLNSHEDYNKWFGAHLVQVIGSSPLVLTTNGQGFIVALLKMINDDNTIPVNLKNAVLALNTIIKGIRGKPVLTREILTPNLQNIISSLIDKLQKDIITVLPVLKSLVLKNTTTFKPFLTRFETKLITILSNENFGNFDKLLQKQVCTCFAYINLVIHSYNQNQQKSGQSIQSLPDDQWRMKIFQILSELSSVIEIYDNLIDLKEESDLVEILKKLSTKYSDSKAFIFPFLSVDLSDPITIVSISKRINVLVQLLIAFITSPTPFPIRVPLGTIVQAGNLLSSLSLNYIPFKRELLRDEGLKRIIANDLTRSQAIGAELIYEIAINYKRLITPHIKTILSSLEVVIPIEKTKQKANSKIIKIDEEFALSIESVLLQIIKTSVELLKLSEGLTEYDLINKLIDVCMLYVKKRTPLDGLLDKQENKHLEQSQKNKKNKKKGKDSTPLADVLSHAELFELEPPISTINVISSFFEIILKNFPKISINSRLKIVKYLIGQAVKQNATNGQINARFVKLLEIIVLFPGEGEVYSFLPIIKILLPNNEKLSLLTNPRLPPLDTKYNVKKQEIVDENEDDDKQDDDEEPEESIDEELKEEPKQDFLQDFKPNEEPVSTTTETIFKTDEEVKTLQFAKAEEKKEQEQELKKVRILEEEEEETTPSKRIKIVEEPSSSASNEIKVTVENEEDSSDGEFEIPEIEIDSDEE